jgi:hypothetical protein
MGGICPGWLVAMDGDGVFVVRPVVTTFELVDVTGTLGTTQRGATVFRPRVSFGQRRMNPSVADKSNVNLELRRAPRLKPISECSRCRDDTGATQARRSVVKVVAASKLRRARVDASLLQQKMRNKLSMLTQPHRVR